MNVGDLHKVWEIRTLKRKVGGDEARKFLDKIAKQVQPIMLKHKWRVKVLSEMCPKNPHLLGLNVGHGVHVKLRLRRPNTDWDFYPFDEVLDTMLHELCHNAIGPHNVSFYNLWDELRKECEELMSKGISGCGRRLGGSLTTSSLRETALVAAEKRQCHGPKRVGGDMSIMSALTPVQAAAMAAERRFQDDIWCGHELVLIEDDEEESVPLPQHIVQDNVDNVNATPQKRNRQQSSFVPSNDTSSANKKGCIDLTSECDAYTSSSSSNGNSNSNSGWECLRCTLVNPALAPICEICGTHKPKHKYKTWSCEFCTLENGVELEKCGACEQWRYSYAQLPLPNVPT